MSDLKTKIAHELAKTSVGLQRAELALRIDQNADAISSHLNQMLSAGHVAKSGSGYANRWSITPQGRSNYSVLHDEAETDDEKQAKTEAKTAEREEQYWTEQEMQTIRDTPETMLLGNTPLDASRTIDAAIIGLVNAIRDNSTAPTVTNRLGAYQLLDIIAASPLYSDYYHGVAMQIKSIIERLEDAA